MNLGTLRQQLLYPSWAGDAATVSDNIESPGMLDDVLFTAFLECLSFLTPSFQ